MGKIHKDIGQPWANDGQEDHDKAHIHDLLRFYSLGLTDLNGYKYSDGKTNGHKKAIGMKG